MPYQVKRSDGTLLTTIRDNTKETEATSLTLLGRGVVDYGESTAENFVHMLENFAGPVAPANPMQGQTWYHTFDAGPPITVVNKLKLYDGTGWINVGSATNSVNPPENPEPGDLWYNVEDSTIYYWDGFSWKKIGGPFTGLPGGEDPATIDPNVPIPGPADPDEGELWWMLPERKLWAFDSAYATKGTFPPNSKRVDGTAVPNGWILIGPDGLKNPDDPGAGTFMETVMIRVFDPAANQEIDHPVILFISNGELISVISDKNVELLADEVNGYPFGAWFWLEDPIETRYKVIRPGINMNHRFGKMFNGQVADSDRLNGLNASQFLRSDETTYPMYEDVVFDLGTPTNHWRRFYAQNIYAGTSNGDTEVYDTDEVNVFGKALRAEIADAAETAISFLEAKNLTTDAATQHIDIDFLNLFASPANDYTGTAMFSPFGEARIKELAVAEATTIVNQIPTGDFVPLDKSSVPTGAHNLGDASTRWGTIFAGTFDGTATKARYADLAERYASDATYVPGTLLSIGGTHEVTITSGAYDYNYFGVVSTNPGLVLNDAVGSNATHPLVAIAGRVPVRVIGPVRKGQRLILSEIPGVARATSETPEMLVGAFIVGRALVSNDDDHEKLVLASVLAK